MVTVYPSVGFGNRNLRIYAAFSTATEMARPFMRLAAFILPCGVRVAIPAAASLCVVLEHHGVKHIHIYACNPLDIPIALAHILAYPVPRLSAA